MFCVIYFDTERMNLIWNYIQTKRGISNQEEARRIRNRSRERVKFTKFMLIKEIVLLIVFGIVLPTADIYSDVVLIHELHTNPTEFRCYSNESYRVIESYRVKDGKNDCQDGSDEIGEYSKKLAKDGKSKPLENNLLGSKLAWVCFKRMLFRKEALPAFSRRDLESKV